MRGNKVGNTALEQSPKQNVNTVLPYELFKYFTLSGSDQQDYPGMRNIPQST